MPATIPWVRDWAAASSKAKATGKLIFIDFFADWCGYCKKLDSETFPSRDVIAAMQPYIPLRLDTEREGKTLARRYGVSSLPTLLVLDADGNEKANIRGFLPPSDLTRALQGIQGDHSTIVRLKPLVRRSPGDSRMAMELLRAGMRLSDKSAVAIALPVVETRSPRSLGYGEWGELGKLSLRTNQWDEGRRRFAKAMTLAKNESDRATCQFMIGVSHYRAGNTSEARRCLQQVAAMPGCPPKLAEMAQQGIKQLGKR